MACLFAGEMVVKDEDSDEDHPTDWVVTPMSTTAMLITQYKIQYLSKSTSNCTNTHLIVQIHV